MRRTKIVCTLGPASNTQEQIQALVDAGMNDLLRPSLYGARHEIVPLRRADGPLLTCDVVGPICESGDTLGYSRSLPAPAEGDVLLIANAGAYGRAMASHYNLREPAAEVFLAG